MICLRLSQKTPVKKDRPAVQAHLVYSCTCTCPLRHLACGETSLIHNCLLAPGQVMRRDCTGSSWVVPAQPEHQGGRGHRPLLRHHTLSKIPSSSSQDPAPTYFNSVLCQGERKPAGFAFKASSFPWSLTAQLQSWDISFGWGLGKQFSPQPTDIPLLPEPALGATLWLGPSLPFQTPVSYIWVRFKSSSWPKSFLTLLFKITVSIPDSCPSFPSLRDRK